MNHPSILAVQQSPPLDAGDRAQPRHLSAVSVVLAMLLVCLTASMARAADLVKGDIISVGIGGVNGKDGVYRAGAWVPVRVRLENRSGKQLVCRLGVEQIDLDGDKVLSVGVPIVLDAADVNGREAWLYYWPRPDDDLHGEKSVVVLDEAGSQVLATLSTSSSLGGGGEARGIGPRDDVNSRSTRFVLVLGPNQAGFPAYFGSFGGTENVNTAMCQNAADIPDNVLGLDGVDTIVWEADQLHPSDLPADFQLRAILNWVKAGGHLIVSVAHQGEDFLKNGDRLRDAMPMTFNNVRELKLDDLRSFPGAEELAGVPAPVTQIIGTLRPDARATAVATGAPGSPLVDHPLAVTGIYGQGAVTVLTVDISNPEIGRRISDHQWIVFWNQVAGWEADHDGARPALDQILTKEEFDTLSKQATDKKLDLPVYMPARDLHIGDDVPRLVDVTETTRLDLLVAVLFLGIYWLAAGPIGHLVLRYYKVVHWSWWVFGATVVVAAGVAGGIVLILQLTNYDVRHKTILLGTVGSKDVSIVGYYGVYAPASGGLPVSLPQDGGANAGMNYLAPMCMPTVESVKPFADPQSYLLSNEHPANPSPVFRNTLKKMQGRWSGTHDGIEGKATFTSSGTRNPLTGTLVNHSGYDLNHVEFLIHYPPYGHAQDQGFSYLYAVDDWKNGASIDLAKALQIEHSKDTQTPFRLDDVLQALGHRFADSGGIAATIGHTVPGVQAARDESALVMNRSDDLLYLLLDARHPDALLDSGRVEPIRVFARTTDCTKAFYAAGALIVARAGDIPGEHYVASPVPVTVNGRVLPGKGDVLFAWTLPLAGNVAAAPAMPDLNQAVPPATKPAAAPTPGPEPTPSFSPPEERP